MESKAIYNPLNVPQEIGYYIAGFTDGEGSFNFSFRRRSDYKTGWKVSACFNVSNKDLVILNLFQKYLKCGTLRSRPGGVWYYEVNSLNDLTNHRVPFFKVYGFLSEKKRNDFSKFCQILAMLVNEQSKTAADVRKILDLRNQMNHGGKRKYSDAEILTTLR